VCGKTAGYGASPEQKRAARKTLYDMSYDKMVARWQDKRAKLHTAIEKLKLGIDQGTTSNSVYQEVRDRVQGFLKCHWIDSAELAKSAEGDAIGKMIGNEIDGYKTQVRKGDCALIMAKVVTHQILPPAEGSQSTSGTGSPWACSINANRLDGVVNWPADEPRDDVQATEEVALKYIFGEQCDLNLYRAAIGSESKEWLEIAESAVKCSFDPDGDDCWKQYNDPDDGGDGMLSYV